MSSATRSPRSRSRAASSTSPIRSTACTRSPTRRRCTATSREIDVFEVYNARLLFETYNDEALRFARKYNLTMGAGSDAHVLQGVGTGALRMRAFDGPEEFLLSLRTAEILRRPKSLALPAVAEVGGAGKGTGPVGEKSARAVSPCRPTRSTSATSRRRSPRSTSSGTRSRTLRASGFPVVGSGPSARRRLPAQVRAAGVRGAGGRAVLRPRRPGDLKSLQRLQRRPAGGLRDELPEVRRRRSRSRRARC